MFTIITLAKDNPEEVRRTLTSLSCIKGVFELVIIDGSIDEKVKSVVNEFRLIKVLYRYAQPTGIYEAMNIGLNICSKYKCDILFLNSGDELLFDPTSVYKPGYVNIFLVEVFNSENQRGYLFPSRLFMKSRSLFALRSRFKLFSHQAVIFPIDDFRFDERIRLFSDLEHKKYLLKYKKYNLYPKTLSRFHLGGASTSYSSRALLIKDLKLIWNKKSISTYEYLWRYFSIYLKFKFMSY
jgi:hypothetical protein